MTWFRNRRTATKLLIGFGVVAALAALMGAQALYGMGSVKASSDALYQRHALGLAYLKEADVNMLRLSRAVRNVVLDVNPGSMEKHVPDIAAGEAGFLKAFGEYEKRIVDPKNKATAGEIDGLFKQLRARQDSVVAATRAGAVVGLAKAGEELYTTAGIKDVRAIENEIEARMKRLEQAKFDLMEQSSSDAATAYGKTWGFVLAMVGLVIAAAIVIGIVIARLIARPLGQTVTMLKDIAEGEGDLTKRLDVTSEDEVGELARWFNTFMDKLQDIIGQVKDAAAHAGTAAQQLSAATEQLASGSHQQASSLEETAASLEEITGTVRQNADNAKQANQLAVGSRDSADKGGQVVTSAVQAMDEINKASRKIADIITTIDEIAFQTNLLALNAAVEAARAGEQGRGFAVVAAEVRNLAQRSATAAKEIKALIQDSVTKVGAGSELVNQSGQTLGEIVASVKRVTDIIAEIAAASQEQSSGIDQVNKAVTQMDQVVQANSAQTEELTSTAQALAAQADQLQALVGRFKVDDGRRAARESVGSPSAVRGASSPVRSARALPVRPSHPERKTWTPSLELAATGAHAGSNDAAHANGNGVAHGLDFEEF